MIRTVTRASSLSGTVMLPGDKSISHRYAMLAAVAEGSSVIRHFAASQDCHSTLSCLECLGVDIRQDKDTVVITGLGLHGLKAPLTALDAGNSGTTIRLLSGIVAGYPFETVIAGDASLSRRPMRRVMQPLRLMGAGITGREGDLPPLRIRGGSLKGLRYPLPVASAQVKSCVLLAGMYADCKTAVEERIPTRDHTEIALAQFGAVITREDDWISVEPEPQLKSQSLEVPGDLSGAAFFLIGAALVPNSILHLPGVGLNHRRRQLLDYLRFAGMKIMVENETYCGGEARGDIRVVYDAAFLRFGLPPIQGKLVAALIDEIPVLSILGSQVAGGLEISDAGELRIKESDRISALAENLKEMGASVEEKAAGLKIHGNQRLRGANIRTRGDHRIAMAFAIAGLAADGETCLEQAECADVSYPGFYDALDSVQPK